ncbi:hypothetical protein J7L27_06075 [Candidatus Bathyarchaeota archaeon]|nr:hypothetical protein [Candidatus Bathyarchaeota archaeon]
MSNRSFWMFFSTSAEDIDIAFQNRIWGFWHKDLVREGSLREKLVRTWKQFLKAYSQMKPLDLAFFQTKLRGSLCVVGLAVLGEKFYDDQTIIFTWEKNAKRVLFPFRIKLNFGMYSLSEPIIEKSLPTHEWIEGQGIGRLEPSDILPLVSSLEKRTGFKFLI